MWLVADSKKQKIIVLEIQILISFVIILLSSFLPIATRERMPSNLVKLVQTGSIARIVFQSGPLNLMSTNMMVETSKLINQITDDKATRMLVLESQTPEVFSHGLDPHEGVRVGEAGRKNMMDNVFNLLKDLHDTPVQHLNTHTHTC